MYEAPSHSSAVLHADPTWIAPVLSTYTSSMFTCAEESPVTLQRGAKSCRIEARCFTWPTLVRVLLTNSLKLYSIFHILYSIYIYYTPYIPHIPYIPRIPYIGHIPYIPKKLSKLGVLDERGMKK